MQLQPAPRPRSVRRRSREPDPLGRILPGDSQGLRLLREELRALAGSPFQSLLVQGETGSGKDRIPYALLACAPHLENRVETFHCALTCDEVLDAELFGSVTGAFPGALDRPGAIERAGGGLLVLDDVACLSLGQQAKLVHLIESRVIRRLGASRTIPVRARIVATSNRDLAAASEDGSFRADLYYRLCCDGALRVPPLRERLDDLPVLVAGFLAELPNAPRITRSALSLLRAQPWPGNVRQLRAVVRSAVRGGRGGSVGSRAIERAILDIAPHTARPATPRPRVGSFQRATRELRRGMLVDALEAAGGNQTLAGILLGLHEPRHTGDSMLNLQARKLAHRKFRYWWSRVVDSGAPDPDAES